MDDQATPAVESDPLERMMQFVEDDGSLVPDEAEQSETEAEETEQEAEETTEEPEAEEEYEEITHNGKVKRLTKTELKELAQQGFDYTQKTQNIADERRAIADERRAIEAERQAVQQRAQFHAQFTDQIATAKALQGQLEQFKQVNWAELAQSDPMQYLGLHTQYTEAKEAYNNQIQHLNQLQAQAQQAQAQQQQARIQKEAQAMRQAIPEWKNDAVATAEMGEIRQFLARAGFAEQEIGSVADHRQVAIARKAMMYDKLMQSGQKKVQAAPPAAKPGHKAQNPNASKTAELRQRLKSTGNADYAAKLIEGMI